MRFLLAFLLTASAGLCQIRDVLKSGEIDQMFARTSSVECPTAEITGRGP